MLAAAWRPDEVAVLIDWVSVGDEALFVTGATQRTGFMVADGSAKGARKLAAASLCCLREEKMGSCFTSNATMPAL